ncbi:hypothetical protein M413DRAFT_444712 [Hebeloma cylindrosporum]|uniref:Uncharacterized protein n=1 Tax=Hebeloma cylindrosporum TaxID=76867 RepID=A0A0C2YMP3_HEBCY|nr:hypothetical protein M413DRAFT_444712 [Hebeloma cylindrosporum h7]
MSFFFPSSPSTSDATTTTTSSLASSPRVRVGAGTDSELTITPVTPTVTQHVSPTTSPTSPRSPGTAATSTTRAGPGSGSFKVGKNVRDSDFSKGDDGEDENGNSGYAYGDEGGSVLNPLSRGASDVYQHLYQPDREHQQYQEQQDQEDQQQQQQQQQYAATHTTRSDHHHDRGLSDLGANLERSVDRLLRLMVVGESGSYSLSSSASSSSSSLSSLLDDRSAISGRSESRKVKGKEKEKEKSREKVERRMVEDASPGLVTLVSASSAVQGARPLTGMASPPVPPVGGDDEETRARARSHRRRSSHTHARQSSRRLVMHKRQEVGISRDFVLIVALCVGFACAIVLVARPAAMVVFSQRGGGWDLD